MKLLSLLRYYTLNSRPPEEEAAYRDHFLDGDIAQLTASVYVIASFILILTLLDLLQLKDHPELLIGVIVKAAFFLLSLGVSQLAVRLRRPEVLNLGVLIYTVLYACAILTTHITGDYSAIRIVVIAILFIFTAHLALPVYAIYLFPAMGLLIAGELIFVISASRNDLAEASSIIIVALIFAEAISVLSSALLQQSRHRTFLALSQVKTLSGFLPICSSCKKIRDDKGYYQQIEQYISDNSDATFTHGICPSCSDQLYGDYKEQRED